MSFTYPTRVRLRAKSDFDSVFNMRKRLYGRYFLAYYRSSDVLHPRFGLITSKRNIRLAVDRNRVRRLAKEQFRQTQAKLPNLDMVFIAKKGAAQAANYELVECIGDLLQQLKKKANS